MIFDIREIFGLWNDKSGIQISEYKWVQLNELYVSRVVKTNIVNRGVLGLLILGSFRIVFRSYTQLDITESRPTERIRSSNSHN